MVATLQTDKDRCFFSGHQKLDLTLTITHHSPTHSHTFSLLTTTRNFTSSHYTPLEPFANVYARLLYRHSTPIRTIMGGAGRNISHGRGGAGKNAIPEIGLFNPCDPSFYLVGLPLLRTTNVYLVHRTGNIYSKEHHTTTKDLVTPTIKQDFYTTGRGGSGNMVYNDPERPDIARERQDVESPPLRVEEAPHHTGRGMDSLLHRLLVAGDG